MKIRLGLCNEYVGQLEKAVEYYRDAIAAAPSPRLTFASHLNLARCLLRQSRPSEVRHLLYPFIFEAKRQESAPPEFVIDAYYLVALSMARLHKDSYTELIAFTAAPLEIEMYLDAINAAPSSPAEVETTKPLMEIFPAFADEPALVVRATASTEHAKDWLDHLAAEAGLQAEWTAEARKIGADRSLRLDLHNWELRDVFELVADHLHVVCQFDGDKLRFSTPAQTDEKTMMLLERSLTQRALYAAVRSNSIHRYAPAAFLELGNIEASLGKWNDAVQWYQRLLRDAGSSNQVVAAHFNLALIQCQGGNLAASRKAFFNVMDHAPGHELALRAGWEIAQICLQENEAAQAIVHLKRIQSFAVRSPHHPPATLLLAAAYLHQGEIEAARKTLADHRAELSKEPFRASASFLDSYAQYRFAAANAESGRSQQEISEVIGNLWRTKDDPQLGAYGQWLAGHTYLEFGFFDQAERLLRRSLSRATSPFKACVEISLAETLVKRRRFEEANERLVKWENADSPYRARARFQLARIDLEEKRFRECADRCRTLWQDRAFSNQAALLSMWGAALEGVGDLTKAAKCYAGQAPD